MMTNRRNFLKKASLGIAGGLIGSSFLMACTNNQKRGEGPFANIGLQLYTLRDLLDQDPKLTLETISKIGYTHVETYGLHPVDQSFWGIKTPELKNVLKANNLSTFSGHYDLSKYLNKQHDDKENIEKYIEVAHQLGQQYIVVPNISMDNLNEVTPADYQYAAEQLNKAGELAKKSGIKIAYHNHFWEFRDFANGTKGLDILIAFTEPELVNFELDIYWAEKAGISPLTYFQKYPGRFPLWHIKDMDKRYVEPIVGTEIDKLPYDSLKKDVRFTEVGTGHIDYINIAQEAKTAGLAFAYIEQDDIYLPNKFESIKRSFDYVQRALANKKA